MRSRWSDRDARAAERTWAGAGRDVALRTYTARLIGADPALVLHGGGNTSVKTRARTLAGETVDVLCVKGSGWDLASIEPPGHPAVRLDELRRLRRLERLSDEDMVAAFRSNLLDPRAPTPSVETLLHAFLPHRFIDHTHADAVLAVLDQPDAERKVVRWTGGKLAFVPYIMPGFALAKLAAHMFESSPQVEGLLLSKHGIFTFGDTARESYERMIRWVDRAERQLAKERRAAPRQVQSPDLGTVAKVANRIRGACAIRRDGAATPMIVRHRAGPAILEFLARRDLALVSQRGPATPDHVIRTKPRPLLLPAWKGNGWEAALAPAVARFEASYLAYVRRASAARRRKVRTLDPMPRVVLVPGVGMFGLGEDAKAADVALDIYEHTIDIVAKATRFGRYEPLSDADLFDLEYWSLEQAKLGKRAPAPFDGRVVWISGAASGIGTATAREFERAGAHVFATDVRPPEGLGRRSVAAVCDVTDERAVRTSFEQCSQAFGGVDIVVSNAGSAPTGAIHEVDDEALRRSFELNFFAHQAVARAAADVFLRQGLGGVLLFNASKSAFNPGPDFGPYALPKAGVIALMKQYAVDLGRHGVRSNAVNADRVRTGLFAGGLLERRAKARGLTPDAYLRGNLLGEEVLAEDVAQAFVLLAQARKTTGTTLTVDGGNAAAFPR